MRFVASLCAYPPIIPAVSKAPDSFIGSSDGYLYALFASGSQAGQLKYRYYVSGGSAFTGVLSPSGDVLYGGSAITPGSSIYALQLPSDPAPSPPTPPPPALSPPSDDIVKALRGMQAAFAILFLFTWLVNIGGVCYYCRAQQIATWPHPLLSAVFLYVRLCSFGT